MIIRSLIILSGDGIKLFQCPISNKYLLHFCSFFGLFVTLVLLNNLPYVHQKYIIKFHLTVLPRCHHSCLLMKERCVWSSFLLVTKMHKMPLQERGKHYPIHLFDYTSYTWTWPFIYTDIYNNGHFDGSSLLLFNLCGQYEHKIQYM